MANTPVFFTSFEPTVTRLSSNFEQTLCLRWNSVAKALAMALLVMARATAFVVAFIGAFVLGNMARKVDSELTE